MSIGYSILLAHPVSNLCLLQHLSDLCQMKKKMYSTSVLPKERINIWSDNFSIVQYVHKKPTASLEILKCGENTVMDRTRFKGSQLANIECRFSRKLNLHCHIILLALGIGFVPKIVANTSLKVC